MRTRIVRAANDEDRSGLLAADAEREAGELTAVIDAEHDLKAAWVLGMYHWLRYEILPYGNDEDDFAAAARFLAPVYQDDPDLVPEALRRRYQRSQRRGRTADPDPRDLSRRALGLVDSYQSGGGLPLLAEAVSLLRAAAAATPRGDPDRGEFLSQLGAALRLSSEGTGDDEQLAEAIAIHRAAVAATPTDIPGRAVRQFNLATALATASMRSGRTDLGEEAVSLFRASIAATPAGDPDRGIMLSNLAAALTVLSQRLDRADLLTESVGIHRAAVAVVPPGHPDRASRLSNLGAALMAVHERTGDDDAIAEAVESLRAALDVATAEDPDRVGLLSNLAAALTRQAERTGDAGLLAEAVDMHRSVLADEPAVALYRAEHLSSFAVPVTQLGEYTGQAELVAEGVAASRMAVNAVPAGHPERSGHLSNLGVALQALFELTGNAEALAEAVDAQRAAVAAAPLGHPDHAACLSHLGLVLRMQFGLTGETDLLAEGISAARAAVAGAPPGHPDRAGCLSNLGAALQEMAEHTESADLLDEAMAALRAAATAVPEGHPDRARYLSNLGLVLQTRFDLSGDVSVLAEAVACGRAAVAAAGAGYPGRAAFLSNLGLALRLEFEHTGHADLLVEAATCFLEAANATPAGYEARASYLSNRGNALQLLARQSERAAAARDYAEAARCYAEAAGDTAAPAMVRIWAYRQLARLPGIRDTGEAALDAMEAAVGLLPQIAPRALARKDRERRLGQVEGLAADAAAAAISAGRPDRAVELLEQTRGILVADILHARSSDMTALREGDPQLAAAFEAARACLGALDQATLQMPQEVLAASPDRRADGAARQPAAGSSVRGRREAYDAWVRTIGRIRESGFPDFLRPPKIGDLAAQAVDSPVVFVSASPVRCDALIVQPEQRPPVRVVPLGLTETELYQKANEFVAARTMAITPDITAESRDQAHAELLDVLAWLWDAVTGPVLAALGCTSTPPEGTDWPRIWWCPLGILAYLPLHAAGHHAEVREAATARIAAPRTVLDRVISSYATTLRGLAYARQHRVETSALSTLIVPVPEVAGYPLLPGVAAEAAELSRVIPGARVLADPRHDTVLAALPHHAVVHFSCHGHADMSDPSASKLVLRDHEASPLTVSDISALHLNASLAYLSACDTGISRQELADEAIHITGAFHLAGYQHVIGTLWPIFDRPARQLALDVYAHLTRDGTTAPDASLAAWSLHQATRRMRSRYPGTPTLWAAYVHTGV